MSGARAALLYFAAVALRLAVAPFFGHSWDVYVWIQSGELFLRGINVYEVKSLTDFPWGFYTYPPVWLYWVGFVSYVATFFNDLHLQVLLLKAPIIVADIAVAVLISKIAGELGLVKYAGLAVVLWLFNPLVIGISSVWGMFDSIAVMLSLIGFLLMLRGKTLWAGAALGLGGAVKIFPVLLIVPAGVYLKVVRKASATESLKPLIGAVFGSLTPTIPFLQNPLPLVDKLFYHFGNIGSFTYWTVLSVVSPPPAIPILSYGLFILLLYYTIRQSIRGGWGLFDMWMTTLLAFLSTSAKVNVQYVLWVLPLLLLHVFRRKSRDLYLNTTLLVAAGLLFILAAQTVLAIFDLRNLGRIVVSRELESLTLGGALLIFSAILGGSRFVTLVVNILRGEMKNVWTLQRITFISLFMIFALVVGILPTGQGVIVPRASVRVGVSEGIESLFDKAEEYNTDFLVSKYKLTHIVIPIGPDGILYGGDYSKSVRFKLTNSEWSKDDLKKLVESIKSAGVRPLLGVYLKTHYVSVHYGYHGFNSTHLIANFPECVSRSGNIQFNCVNSKKINLAEFFAERTAAETVSMNFTGIYLMGVDWSRDDHLEGLRTYLTHLKKATPKGFLVFLEYDPMSSKRPLTSIESNRDLFSLVDYVVVVTNPFIRSIKEPLGGNYTVAGFKAVLENVVRSSGSRVLFSVHAMDIAEGWMTPAIQLQTEVNEFSEVDGVAGYAVYHVSRYLPVKLSLK